MIDWTPSPVAIQLGPLPVYWYGIAYASGLAAAYLLLVRQAKRFGQNGDLVGNGLIIVAVAALIGGRLYHVIDQWHLYADDPIKIFLPPYSGLGVFGGFITGAIAFLLLARHYRVSIWIWGDVLTAALFAFQAIARWGNFFNQELYGTPTTLPWGLAIDCAHRVVEYPCTTFPLASTDFHPLFLYESLSATLGLAFVLWISRRPPAWLKVGMLFPILMIWMGGVRFLTEFLRTDSIVWRLGGIPTAQLFGAAFVALGIVLLVWRARVGEPVEVHEIDRADEDEEGWEDDDEGEWDEDTEGEADEPIGEDDVADVADAVEAEAGRDQPRQPPEPLT